jgi:acyl carrier protein phosphodiesterase
MFLSGDASELLVGNLMGDFVKGRLNGRFPPGIERGILLHREIDSCRTEPIFFVASGGSINPSVFIGGGRSFL